MENTNKPVRFLCAILVAGCILSMGTPVFAEDCRDTAFTQAEMNLCVTKYAKRAEKELNAIYRKLMRKIGPESRKELRVVQKAWSEFRKKQCEVDTLGVRGNAAHSMMVAYCSAKLAERQKRLLQFQLECKVEDLACGGH